MKKLLIIILSLITLEGFAQNDKALTLSVIKESTKIPSGRVLGKPFHPGTEVGYDYFLANKTKHQFLLSVKIGYYFHKDLHHGLTLKPAITYNYLLQNNIYFGTELNLGYLHTFVDKPIFKQNSNGEYQRVKNFGKSKFLPSIGLASGYRFQKEDKNHLDLFLKYEFSIETPFSKGIGIPIFPHSFFHLGTRWYAFN